MCRGDRSQEFVIVVARIEFPEWMLDNRLCHPGLPELGATKTLVSRLNKHRSDERQTLWFSTAIITTSSHRRINVIDTIHV
jgi:hypothetical protein